METSADGRETRQLGLRLVLRPDHFTDGRLTLTCLAAIASVYSQQAEITVQQPTSRPQPPAKTLEVKEPNGEQGGGVGVWLAIGQGEVRDGDGSRMEAMLGHVRL